MSTNAQTQLKLSFGIELELFLRPRVPEIHGTPFHEVLLENGWRDHVLSSPDPKSVRSDLVKNRLALRQTVADTLYYEVGIPSALPEEVLRELDLGHVTYRKWLIASEVLREPPHFWGLEIISPIMYTDMDWQGEIDTVFRVLEKYCEIKVTPITGMHVHVGVGQGKRFTDHQLRSICKGLSFFDAATTDILPGDRKDNEYAVPNLPFCEGFPETHRTYQAYMEVEYKTWGPLMKILDGITQSNISEVVQPRVYGKRVAWNFKNMWDEDSGTGTIEFRRPPGVASTKAARHWTAFVLGLFAASMSKDWDTPEVLNRYGHPFDSELREFLLKGLEQLGPHCQGALIVERVVEDNSYFYYKQEQEMIKRWEKENDKIRREWQAQGLIDPDDNKFVGGCGSTGVQSPESAESQSSTAIVCGGCDTALDGSSKAPHESREPSQPVNSARLGGLRRGLVKWKTWLGLSRLAQFARFTRFSSPKSTAT